MRRNILLGFTLAALALSCPALAEHDASLSNTVTGSPANSGNPVAHNLHKASNDPAGSNLSNDAIVPDGGDKKAHRRDAKAVEQARSISISPRWGRQAHLRVSTDEGELKHDRGTVGIGINGNFLPSEVAGPIGMGCGLKYSDKEVLSSCTQGDPKNGGATVFQWLKDRIGGTLGLHLNNVKVNLELNITQSGSIELKLNDRFVDLSKLVFLDDGDVAPSKDGSTGKPVEKGERGL